MRFDHIQQEVAAIVRKEVEDAGQMTLGAFIAALEPLPQDRCVCFDFAQLAPTALDSYRGYYDHLALGFEEQALPTVAALLADAKNAMGRTFVGYKGGEFVMNEHTPMWAANYGRSGGSRIVGVEEREFEVLIRTQPNE
jgi:hypothetical protein